MITMTAFSAVVVADVVVVEKNKNIYSTKNTTTTMLGLNRRRRRKLEMKERVMCGAWFIYLSVSLSHAFLCCI
jgi:hypothetical protein